jgi:uncharacterized FlgJ-related protein
MKKIIIILVFLLINLKTSESLRTQGLFEDPPITYENLYEQILKYGIKFPDVVFAQAVIETGNFTSALFRNANNLFGMKLPKKRETLAIGQNRGFAVFESWTHSVNDYLLWQEYVLRNKDIKTKNEYLAYLNRYYAENKTYVSSLNRVMLRHKELLD